MRILVDSVRRARRGAVAVEFALVCIPLMYMFAGITDLGLEYYQQIALSNAVGAAAAYAQAQDLGNTSSNSTTVSEANIESVLQAAASQAMPHVSTTAYTEYAACYSFPVTTTSWNTSGLTSIPCSGSCVTSSTTIKYVKISISMTYNPVLPLTLLGESASFQPTLQRMAWIPLSC